MTEFCKFLADYLIHPDLVHSLGIKAYNTMVDIWNIGIAVPRFLTMVRSLMNNEDIPFIAEGPCSKAQDININWYES